MYELFLFELFDECTDIELAKTTECTSEHVFTHGNVKEPSEVYKTIANSFKNKIYNKLYDMLQYQDEMEEANAKRYRAAIINSGLTKKDLTNKNSDTSDEDDDSLEDESILTEHHS